MNHMIKNVPPQYIFCLTCCLKEDCCHPICKSGSIGKLPCWYTEGPLVNYVPLPIPDPFRPWGNSDCTECTGSCYGHFLRPLDAIKSVAPPMAPPSQIIKVAFEALLQYPPSEQLCQEIAKQALLSPDGVRQWMDHLHTVQENRRRGALQAAATRRQRKANREKQGDSSYYCAVCRSPYQEFTDSVEQWIGCDSCDSWFHFVCVGIDASAIPTEFQCEDCNAVNLSRTS